MKVWIGNSEGDYEVTSSEFSGRIEILFHW
jgi:hypothetical protein